MTKKRQTVWFCLAIFFTMAREMIYRRTMPQRKSLPCSMKEKMIYMFGEILEQAKSLEGTFLEKLEFYMVNFSGYIEQGSVQMAQEWVKNVVNPNLVTDSFDKNKLHADLKDMQELFFYGIECGLLKKDFPVEDFAKMLVDVLYGEMLCWCMSDGAYSFRERTQEYCKNYLMILIQPYLI